MSAGNVAPPTSPINMRNKINTLSSPKKKLFEHIWMMRLFFNSPYLRAYGMTALPIDVSNTLSDSISFPPNRSESIPAVDEK